MSVVDFKGANGNEVFDLSGRKLQDGDEYEVGVSRITAELNDLRVTVQGLFGSLIDYSGLQLENDHRDKKLPGRRSLTHKSADMDKLTENTYGLLKTAALKAKVICDRYREDDPVSLAGVAMLRQLCDMIAKSGQKQHVGVLIAYRWWYADGLLRNKRLRVKRNEWQWKWKVALAECEKLLEP